MAAVRRTAAVMPAPRCARSCRHLAALGAALTDEPAELTDDLAALGHAGTSDRTEGCHARTRRSAARVTRLAATPSRPVTTTRAYIAGTAPLPCATAISRPSPGVPMTSSPVTASTSATEVASRTPVSAYGSAVGHTRYRTRAQRPNR